MQAELFNDLDNRQPVAKIEWNPEIKLPEKRYHIVYCDPPWHYDSAQFDAGRGILTSAARFHYPTVKTDVMCDWPIQDICEDDCLLFMWACSPLLKDAIKLGESWGFEYVTIVFIWDKVAKNVGCYTMSNCEVVLLFKRGKIPQPRGARNVQQLHSVQRTKRHSEKPSIIRNNIELMFPTQSKIELFARNRFPGWDCWGNEV